MNPYQLAWKFADDGTKNRTKKKKINFEDKVVKCTFRFLQSGETVFMTVDECLELVVEKDDNDGKWYLKIDSISTSDGRKCLKNQVFIKNGKGNGKGAFLIRFSQYLAKEFQVDKSILDDLSSIHC
jgi:hypothetical protein